MGCTNALMGKFKIDLDKTKTNPAPTPPDIKASPGSTYLALLNKYTFHYWAILHNPGFLSARGP